MCGVTSSQIRNLVLSRQHSYPLVSRMMGLCSYHDGDSLALVTDRDTATAVSTIIPDILRDAG